MEQTIAALQSQADVQARLLAEKDRQILELHALLREAMRRPTLALPAPAANTDLAPDVAVSESNQKPWWCRMLGF